MDNYKSYINQNLSLPLTYTNDFKCYLDSYLDDYVVSISGMGNLLDPNNIAKLNTLVDCIKEAVEMYYNGHPASAYKSLESGLNAVKLELTALRQSHLLGQQPLFRVRENKERNSHKFDRAQMFHIPYEKRTLVATQRFSIPGLPSLYLGSSVYVCWEELNRPNLVNVNAACFVGKENLNIIDLGLPPSYIYSYLNDLETRDKADAENELIIYLLLWPLIAACSVKVVERNHPFKPEYIIPQLLLQYVTQDTGIDGIRYLSVNTTNTDNNFWLNHNYVFPAKIPNAAGFCSSLAGKFLLTQGVSWQVYEIQKSTSAGLPPGERDIQTRPFIIDGTPGIRYGDSDFGRFERFLEDKMEFNVV